MLIGGRKKASIGPQSNLKASACTSGILIAKKLRIVRILMPKDASIPAARYEPNSSHALAGFEPLAQSF